MAFAFSWTKDHLKLCSQQTQKVNKKVARYAYRGAAVSEVSFENVPKHYDPSNESVHHAYVIPIHTAFLTVYRQL